MNGFIGYVKEASAKSVVVAYGKDEVCYDDKQMKQLSLAYAITIHKSQGSEFPVVIFPVSPSANFMLNKKLLYTAVTRTKQQAIIVGDIDLFISACKKDSPKRTTWLSVLFDDMLQPD